MTATTTVLAVATALILAVCEPGINLYRSITNESAHDIWVVHQTKVDPVIGGDRPDELIRRDSGFRTEWTHVPAGQNVEILGSSCTNTGSILVAAAPSLDEVIDERPLSPEAPWCAGDPWTWSGPGDHE